jgi:hypothetical protein
MLEVCIGQVRSAQWRKKSYRVLRRIFGPKRDEVTGGWIKLHNEEQLGLFAKYNYNDQVNENEMGRACSTNRGEEECI